MPVDLQMLLSAGPPLYPYTTFVDSRYPCFPTRGSEHQCSIREKNFINDHHLSPLQYCTIDNSLIKKENPFQIESPTERRVNDRSCSAYLKCSLSHSESKLKEKKRVSFADDKGLALVEVRCIPGSQYVAPTWTPLFSFLTEGLKSRANSECDKIWQMALPKFEQETSDFSEQLDSHYVHLEKANIDEESGNVVLGTIKVKNTGYEKQVFIRITYDRWASFDDVPAEYKVSKDDCDMKDITSSSKNDNSSINELDTFAFSVTIPSSAMRFEVVEFCVGYRVNDIVYWDNNKGVNYRITTTCAEQRHKPSREISKVLSKKNEEMSKFAPVAEHLNMCRGIDSWESFFNDQPYW